MQRNPFEPKLGIRNNFSASRRGKTLRMLFDKHNGRCFYCNCKTKLGCIFGMRHIEIPKNAATIEHVYCRRDIRRCLENKLVLACYKCNQEKNNEFNANYKEWNEGIFVFDIREFLNKKNENDNSNNMPCMDYTGKYSLQSIKL